MWTEDIDKYSKDKLNLFVLKINANEFDYKSLQENLLDPMIEYSVSRQVKEQYKNRPGTLVAKAKEKFVDYFRNTGELGELLLFCFLESHLKAPKILSKLELKTSTSHYVNGSDGVHFLKLENGNYQLIFGESKTINDLTSAISEAFESINNFKNEINEKGKDKSGISYEKGLISDNLLKETFSEEERVFIENIIYPKKENNFEVDDAFGIFIGYEIKIKDEDLMMLNHEFRAKIKEQISAEVKSKLPHIKKKISEYNLWGHNFYIYVLPFSELDKERKSVLEGILK